MGESGRNGAERRGRPQSIPVTAYETVFRLQCRGFGVRRIVRLLEGLGIYSTKSSVSRLLLRQGTYRSEIVTDASSKVSRP